MRLCLFVCARMKGFVSVNARSGDRPLSLKSDFFYHCVCFLCSKQNVNHFRVMYIKHVRHATPLLSHHGTAVFTLPSNRLRVINNPSINTLHRNRSIPEIPDTEICYSETLSIFKYKTQILQYLTWLSMCKYTS